MKNIVLQKIDIYSGNLLLVNAHYPLKTADIVGLTSLDPRSTQILMKRHAVNVLLMILQKISAGNAIVPVSGYRSAQEQTAIYDDSLKENGEEFTRKFVALPNHSEHQTGLAIDLGLNKEDIDFICPDFPYAGICNDFREAAADYGYIQRYAKDKEKITGISHEPWHFRYVGCPHSLIMKDRGFSLEEYTDFIKAYRENSRFVYKQADGKETEVYYVPANDGEIQPNIPESSFYQVSGNNVDGFIVTVWRDNDERKKVLYRY